ncbi:response regulator [Paracoccus shandongensis]|uniref:response regulator n=1 Tax=Paracoccus shandongensis TaxID=2816048 RepID=UPI001A9006F5|nr:response regulator [Paracoccus shandongensis]
MTASSLQILVVEDDFFAADKLSREIRAGGDTVVGPFADVHDAIQRVGLVQAAILDVRVQDESSFQVADSLTHHGIPFVFLTGYDPQAVPARFSRRHVYTKPSHAAPLLHDLHQQHRAMAPHQADSIEAAVIEMIRRSRAVMPDEASADRLVEAALLRAIAETTESRMEGDVRARLMELLDDEYCQRGRLHLQ